jgi:hypothetical protein
MSNAHRLHGKVTMTQALHTLVQFSCPSGCVVGYMWGPDGDLMRATFSALQDQHAKAKKET